MQACNHKTIDTYLPTIIEAMIFSVSRLRPVNGRFGSEPFFYPCLSQNVTRFVVIVLQELISLMRITIAKFMFVIFVCKS